MIPNSELIEWLKKKAETVTMPGARKMYQAAVKALEAQQYTIRDGRLFITVEDVENVDCVLVEEHKSRFCREFWLGDADEPVHYNVHDLPKDAVTISLKAALDICDHAIDLLKGQFGAGALVAIRESIAELPPAQSVAVNCLDRDIRPGDEVERYVDGRYDGRAMFMAEDNDHWTCLFWTGCCYTTLSYPKSQFKRTGRHYNIEPILEGIRNER